MRIRITRHALGRMRSYGISEELIEEAMKKPDSMVDGEKGRKIAQKRINRHVLRIIYEEWEDEKIVITVYKAKSERYEI